MLEISNCCSAPVYDDTDICIECGEHCEVVETNLSIEQQAAIHNQESEHDHLMEMGEEGA